MGEKGADGLRIWNPQDEMTRAKGGFTRLKKREGGSGRGAGMADWGTVNGGKKRGEGEKQRKESRNNNRSKKVVTKGHRVGNRFRNGDPKKVVQPFQRTHSIW